MWTLEIAVPSDHPLAADIMRAELGEDEPCGDRRRLVTHFHMPGDVLGLEEYAGRALHVVRRRVERDIPQDRRWFVVTALILDPTPAPE